MPGKEGVYFSPGEIVALAGDFIGIPEKPISFGVDEGEQEERFIAAYEKLAYLRAKEERKFRKVVAHMEDDGCAARPHANWELRFRKKAKDVLDAGNIQYAIEMADEKSLSGFWHSPYFALALRNFDHFGEEAKKAYLAGHRVAIKAAIAAAAVQIEDVEEREKMQRGLLREAILCELFACHFLTDLFAGGHIRVPRKEILNYLTLPGDMDIHSTPDLEKISDTSLTIAGLFARKMHDEDGAKGVRVRNNKGETWEALGDGNYYNKDNRMNAQKACQAVVDGLNDIVLAFSNSLQSEYATFEKNVPLLDDECPFQPKPMFQVKDNTLYCRGDLWRPAEEKGVEGVIETMDSVSNAVGLIAARFFHVKVKKVATEEESQSLRAAEEFLELKENTEKDRSTCPVQ
jgi:hypothetical protein